MTKIVLDTNSLIRFFTKDDISKAQQVKRLLETEPWLVIPEVVFPEIEYVLLGPYQATRDKVLKAFQFLVSLPNVETTSVVKQAANLYAHSNLDMADCIIASYGQEHDLIASFDKDLTEYSEAKSYWQDKV